MSHPDYRYTPISTERKQRLREAQKKRLGIPVGFTKIYGIFVPDDHAILIRKYAQIVRRFKSYLDTQAFITSARDKQWNISPPTMTARNQHDWELFRILIAEGMSREDVAGYANLSQSYLNKGLTSYRLGKISS